MRFATRATNSHLLLLTAMFLFSTCTGWTQTSTSDDTDISKRLRSSADVLDEVMSAPDKGIPEEVLRDAKCIAVIPSMIKIAVGFGGHYGRGVATCRTKDGWSAPAPILMTGGSWGLQFGGEAVDLVMLVMNQRGMDHLLSSKFKLGADGSVAAGPIGRHVEGAIDWKMKAEVLAYSRARGVFAGIDLNGSVIKQDRDETAVLYGRVVPFSSILHGEVPPPKQAQPFLAVVQKYTSTASSRPGA